MGSARDSEVLDDCLVKQLESEGFMCALPPRAILFMEGDLPRGVHIIAQGHIKLTVCSREGRVLIVKIIEPGEILGLHNCITNSSYEMTAQTLQSSRVSFVKREDLLRVLRNSREACLSAAQRLSRTCHDAYAQVGSIKFSHSASEKLAHFLLTLSADGYPDKSGSDTIRVEMDLTHDEIAQAIGASRETVTRALASFRRKQVASLTRSMLLVKNRSELAKIAGIAVFRSDSAVAGSEAEKRNPASAARPASDRWSAAYAGSGRQAS